MVPHRCSARLPRGPNRCAGSRDAAACHTARRRPSRRPRPAASRAAAGRWTAWRWRTALRSPHTAAGTACNARRLSRGCANVPSTDMHAPLQARAGTRRRGWAPAAQQLAGRAEREAERASLARQRQRAPDHGAQHCRSVPATHSLQSLLSHTAACVVPSASQAMPEQTACKAYSSFARERLRQVPSLQPARTGADAPGQREQRHGECLAVRAAARLAHHALQAHKGAVEQAAQQTRRHRRAVAASQAEREHRQRGRRVAHHHKPLAPGVVAGAPPGVRGQELREAPAGRLRTPAPASACALPSC